jgi:hypothetical protein
MKKVASILAVVVFAVGMFATQAENVLDFDFDIENMLACGDCNGSNDDPREGSGNGAV